MRRNSLRACLLVFLCCVTASCEGEAGKTELSDSDKGLSANENYEADTTSKIMEDLKLHCNGAVSVSFENSESRQLLKLSFDRFSDCKIGSKKISQLFNSLAESGFEFYIFQASPVQNYIDNCDQAVADNTKGGARFDAENVFVKALEECPSAGYPQVAEISEMARMAEMRGPFSWSTTEVSPLMGFLNARALDAAPVYLSIPHRGANEIVCLSWSVADVSDTFPTVIDCLGVEI